MATAWPRDILPQRTTEPLRSGVLLSDGLSGKVHRRSTARDGLVWTEFYSFDASTISGQRLLEFARQWSDGVAWTLQHYNHLTTLGTGNGTPLVNGGSQTGSSIITDGWASGETVLRRGDWVQFDGDTIIHEVDQTTVTSDGSGNATFNIRPAIRSGNSPANNAAITITENHSITAIIPEAPAIPAFGADTWIRGMSVTFQETRE